MTPRLLLTLVMAAAVLTGCATGGERQEAARINTQLGINYLQQDNLNQASQALNKALEQDSRNAEAHAAMAVLSERLDDHDKADRHFRRALRLGDEQPSVHNNYGRFLCNQERYEEADEQFRKAINDPLYERKHLALSNAGLCALRAGRTDKADEYLRRAVEQRPNFAPALRRLAQLRYEQGEYTSARGYYQRFADNGRQNAASLLLGVRIARALGNQDEAASYALRLRSQYPDSEQNRTLQRLDRDD
ncbi:type IV pilus biogenesis/stability protein PilW [Aquisalimonas lutea]|uniref:type IV pilus biogenesis/stability protein PilW n=1 Tax=Aquisalimonas lutea TaxID=1327750 RepID=UPI0025B54331|nr:type IV pilus biogenesis/stability protein PilW [Aquisalimonas lutea]MDN3517904.1 type IV pilus biogenesis/stability protein PilW [Aquisalimonas lutea]